MVAFTGTARLTRLALRRDRIQLPIWILALVGTLAASAASIGGLYDTRAEQLAYARTNTGSAMSRVFNGSVTEPTIGVITMVETYVYLSVLAALMSAMAVVRHTRQNEETGRAELIGSAVVGRHAALTAALLVATGANTVLALLVTGVLLAGGLPTGGSLAAGLAVAAVGVVFAGVAAVTAQVSENARGANGLAGALLGLAFLLRAAGDALARPLDNGLGVAVRWPSWLSPIGWGQRMEPFAAERWWVLGLYALLFAALVRAAFTLTGHRDVGTGMMPVRRGPAAAARGLLSPLGLAWRLQRGVLLAWAVGVAVMSVSMGLFGDEAEDLLSSSEDMQEVLAQLGGTGSMTDVYFAAIMSLFGIVIAGYTVQALLRMRAEETGPLEAVLATAVSRPRWMSAHITCAVLGTLALLLITGLGNGLAYGIAADRMSQVGDLTVAALVQLPATLTLAGLVVAALGLLPRWAVGLSWGALMAFLLVGQFGVMLELPQAVMNLSPFTHTPPLPTADFTATPLLILLAVGAALTAVGVGAFRRRDIAV